MARVDFKIVDRMCKVCEKVYQATNRSNHCSPACRQAAYRQTDKGKLYTEKWNSQFKRPDLQKICRMCKIEFTTARKTQKYCTACSRSDEAIAATQREFHRRNPQHKVAHSKASALVKKFKQRGIVLPCVKCSSHENVELHHPDYAQPMLILPYCRKCHRQLHKFENGKAKRLADFVAPCTLPQVPRFPQQYA